MVKCKCGTISNFGLPDDIKPTCCSHCKNVNMIDIVNKKCKCGKSQPNFGLPDDKKPTCCSHCKDVNMIDIVHKKCKCGKKRPYFGLPDDKKPTCCSHCKEVNMIDIVHKKCKCGKVPSFGLPNDKTPTCCIHCKTDDMINIVTKKCISPFCNMMPNNTKKHDGYCTFCFKNTFPNDPRTELIRSKSKELIVKQFLTENHNGFIHDTVLETSHCDCSHRRRIDFRLLINNTLLCIEVDENQHSSYMKDEIRYNDLMMTFGGKFIFIRFNPDNYRIDGVLKKTLMKTRLNSLSKEINKQMIRIRNEENAEYLEIHKMYYSV